MHTFSYCFFVLNNSNQILERNHGNLLNWKLHQVNIFSCNHLSQLINYLNCLSFYTITNKLRYLYILLWILSTLSNSSACAPKHLRHPVWHFVKRLRFSLIKIEPVSINPSQAGLRLFFFSVVYTFLLK